MSSHPVWTKFREEHPLFAEIYGETLQTATDLVLDSAEDESIPNRVVSELAWTATQEADDILVLCSQDRPWGGLRLLRGLFERTVTLKYLVQNTEQIEAFIEYDAVDRKSILDGIEKTVGYRPEAEKIEWIEKSSEVVRSKLRQERCPECKRSPTNWTKRSSENLAKETNLDHLYYEAYVKPSKYIHPTYYGMRELGDVSAASLDQTLRAVHILTVEAMLAHQRHFRSSPLEMQVMVDAVMGFFKIWTVAPNDFGVGEELQRKGGIFLHGIGLPGFK